MTEPKRWSNPSSEVDPVLRSVLLYGRNLEPTSRQLQAILRGSEQRRPPALRRRFAAVVVAAAAVACVGVAWAGYASGLLFTPTPPPATSAPSPQSHSTIPSSPVNRTTPLSASPADPTDANSETPNTAPRPDPATAPLSTADIPPRPHPEPAPATPAPAPATLDLALAPAAAPSSASAPASAPAPAPSSEQDAALLQQAQRFVTADPARALTLTRDHELHFPASPLAEERQALRIEALARLGRRPEAARDLATFDQRFPHSIYRHRLHALLPE